MVVMVTSIEPYRSIAPLIIMIIPKLKYRDFFWVGCGGFVCMPFTNTERKPILRILIRLNYACMCFSKEVMRRTNFNTPSEKKYLTETKCHDTAIYFILNPPDIVQLRQVLIHLIRRIGVLVAMEIVSVTLTLPATLPLWQMSM